MQQIQESDGIFNALGDRDPEAEEIREILLEKVKTAWIGGVLQPSLADRPHLEVKAEVLDPAVDSPPEDTRATPAPQPGEKLLILGEAGAGKTTALLEIARDRLALAARDRDRPVPVVFRLCTWTKKHKVLFEWLIEQLHHLYQLAPYVSDEWLEDRQGLPFLLLLDGLDEVSPAERQNCADAIDRFCQDRPQITVVVTSAIAEYEALETPIQFDRTLVLRSLTPAQIQLYLAADILPETPAPEMPRTPLTLRLMAEVGTQANCTATPLWNAYIEKKLERMAAESPYSKRDARHWLTWLAQNMCERCRTLFLIEQMQSDWLPKGWQEQVYSLGLWAIAGILTGPIIGLTTGAIGGVVMGWMRGPAGAVVFRGLRGPVAWFWLRLWTRRAIASFAGLLRPLLGMLVRGVPRMSSKLLVKWLHRKIWRSLLRLPYHLMSKTVFRNVTPKLIQTTIQRGFPGWGESIVRETMPNQRVWIAVKNARFFGILGAAILIILAEAIEVSVFKAAIAGLLLGIFAAGGLCIKHLLLRFMLGFMGLTPWNYARFLDWATKVGFLYKVGSGYIFIHPQLQTHLSQLNSAKIE